TTEPTTTEPGATDSTSATDTTSAGKSTADQSTSDTIKNKGTSAVQTGNVSMALIILSVLVSATGVIYFARKRTEK
ncbi:MAG: hypothetical protein Q4A46_08725, partial [Clostridia bacterium]|nr:hypothetical protein [Clostridia bacterium]